MDQVHYVAAEDPQILAAAAGVFFAAAAKFQDLAELARRDEVVHRLQSGAVTGLVRQGELHLVLFTGGDHFVRLGRRAAHRLFHVHMAAPLGGGQDQVAMLIEPAGADRHNLRLRLVEQLPIVGIPAGSASPLHRLGEPLLVGIGHAHHFAHLGEVPPDRVDAVPIVAAARVSDNRDAKLGGHECGSGGGRKSCRTAADYRRWRVGGSTQRTGE
ncbi:MAG: hypothetical protein MUF06_14035 [Pirellulaceae bacterium]|nr:hypothetical protein [Pirellulaceae bacterium]